MISENFVILGAVLNLIGCLSYLISTIKGQTKPNRISWFLWALAPLIAFSAELKNGVGLTSLMTFIVGFCPLLIFLVSFVNKNSSWKFTKLDLICGLLSLMAIIFWQITGSGNLAIFFSILADGLAGIPTIVKSFKEPEGENWHAFFWGSMNATITLLTIKTWNFAHYAFPLFIFLVSTTLTLLIKFKLGEKFKSIAIKYGK